MTDNISMGPYQHILHKLALARQHKTGESYEVAFTTSYNDPVNAMLREGMEYDYLARPITYDTPGFHAKPVPQDAKVFFGPAHTKMQALALDYQRDNPGMTSDQRDNPGMSLDLLDYQRDNPRTIYGILYNNPENAQLRARIKVERLIAAA